MLATQAGEAGTKLLESGAPSVAGFFKDLTLSTTSPPSSTNSAGIRLDQAKPLAPKKIHQKATCIQRSNALGMTMFR
ncbi:MAG: hypothetical protein AW07_02518 [Candidatus Accumulibacter sp. SK-11]|nr:MAG: hypothetical protein AW07_02518 [Candidatus Accumulibacter sp. SK-11]